MSGRFVTFEGGEGVGKSTQVKRLLKSLSRRAIPAVRTREPGGTPKAIVDLLHAEMVKVNAAPDVRAKLQSISYDPIDETLDQFTRRITSDTARWARIVRDTKIQVTK